MAASPETVRDPTDARVSDALASDALADDFLAALRAEGFTGDGSAGLASRLACATDNSIYQIVPRAVVHPRDGDDLARVMRVARRPPFRTLKLYARGGGTSTNGQSLGGGIVVDTSRHMQRILEHDPAGGRVRVEPGLIRDALCDFLRPHGRFFAPHVSTTDRATLGGMVSNDSSGKGSLVHGKTSDHLVSVEVVLPNGETVELGRVEAAERATLPDAVRDICERVEAVVAPLAGEIEARFPDMTRGFTGYNLKEVRDEDGTLNLAKLFAGSEGTLGLIRSITLSTEPLPAHTALVVLLYPSHDAGLRAVPELLAWRPSAIEFVDDKILGAALRSPFADDVRTVLGVTAAGEALAAQFFELVDEDAATLERRLDAFRDHLDTPAGGTGGPTSYRVVRDAAEIARVWSMRRACQGLIAGFDRSRRAVAFVEDCAVPPAHLADFVAELDAFLAERDIPIGMYGHADVGCVHIRPLMDLTREHERRRIREVSDAVFALTRKYGGLIWGEHGKGFRGEYSEGVVGPTLYRAMCRIKGVFDPDDRMNPGKIARPEPDDTAPHPPNGLAPVPSGDTAAARESAVLIPLDTVTMRGELDERISPALRDTFGNVLRCDGNGACFNRDVSRAMCPSYKASGDRRLSPKGRAGVLREWLTAMSNRDAALANAAARSVTPADRGPRTARGSRTAVDAAADAAVEAIADELHEVLDTCLACKACAGAGCSARVDIPSMKSRFLASYHRTRRRPPADYLVAALEPAAPYLDRLGGLGLRALLSSRLVRAVLARGVGLVDLPAFRRRRHFLDALRALDVDTLTAARLLGLPDAERERAVVIVQDCFTSFFDADALVAQLALVRHLGFAPILLSYREGGKPLHVKGFTDRFERLAARNARELAALERAGFPLLGVDPATTLMYRHEYRDGVADCPAFTVSLLDEWLASIELPNRPSDAAHTLIQHCTERALSPASTARWASVFRRAGVNLRIVEAGCCGMSGLFGHEASHQDMSRTLYDQSWRDVVEADASGTLIASGYSCRSQATRLSGVRTLHPAAALLAHLTESPTAAAQSPDERL